MLKKFVLTAAFVVAACSLIQAADYSKLPKPLDNAKVGQWVHYKIMGGMEQKQSITAIEGDGDDRVITLTIEIMQNGAVVQSQETKLNLKEAKAQEEAARASTPDVTIVEETITVNGKSYDAVVVEGEANGMKSRIYMSEKIPVSGMLKMDAGGMAMLELVDFGE